MEKEKISLLTVTNHLREEINANITDVRDRVLYIIVLFIVLVVGLYGFIDYKIDSLKKENIELHSELRGIYWDVKDNKKRIIINNSKISGICAQHSYATETER